MALREFIARRRPVWDRFAQLVDRLYKRSPRRAGADVVTEVIDQYRDVAADLARLRAHDADPGLIRQVNRLVSRAHAQIYRGGDRRSFSVREFFTTHYPRLFRQTWRFTAASFILCAAFYLMAYHTVQERPELVSDVMGGMMDREFAGAKTPGDIRDRFREADAVFLSSAVTTNNIKVALTAFALGITFGIGTIWVLIVNGSMLGGIAGAFANSGIEGVLWMTILPHGALELSAIIVAGGAGLQLAWPLWCPGQRTRRRALREDAVKAVLLAVGLVPAFIVAGFFEGFVTPSDVLGEWLKLAMGLAVAAVFWAWLIFAGHESPNQSAAGATAQPAAVS